jgi:hypothetical protein
MKKSLLFSMILVTLILGACTQPAAEVEEPASEGDEAFELYLVADSQMGGADMQRYELKDLPLAEEPIITTEDIDNYLWDIHAINLNEEAYKKIFAIFSQGMPMSGVPFVILAKGERIYAGAFWSMASSLPFDGVTILQPFDPAGSPLIISLGYPTQEFYTGQDPRSDERLRSALEEAGLLFK